MMLRWGTRRYPGGCEILCGPVGLILFCGNEYVRYGWREGFQVVWKFRDPGEGGCFFDVLLDVTQFFSEHDRITNQRLAWEATLVEL